MPDAFRDYEDDLRFNYPAKIPFGGFTTKHVEALQGDIKWELIDGILYMMVPPSMFHNFIVQQLERQLLNYFENKACNVFDGDGVKLFADDTEGVIPDLAVVCDMNKLKDPLWIMGAPDFIIEVMSPKDKGKDLVIKKERYELAGVREYWVIDMVKDYRIYQYVLEAEVYTEKVITIDKNKSTSVAVKVDVGIFPECYLDIPIKSPAGWSV